MNDEQSARAQGDHERAKQKVWCVVSWHGKETNRLPERKIIYAEGDRRFVMVEGLRYRLNEFNEYHMAYGNPAMARSDD